MMNFKSAFKSLLLVVDGSNFSSVDRILSNVTFTFGCSWIELFKYSLDTFELYFNEAGKVLKVLK